MGKDRQAPYTFLSAFWLVKQKKGGKMRNRPMFQRIGVEKWKCRGGKGRKNGWTRSDNNPYEDDSFINYSCFMGQEK
jgi:hypothetical protein